MTERIVAFPKNPNCPRRFVKPHARWAALTSRTGAAINGLRLRRDVPLGDKDNPLQFFRRRATLKA